MDQETNIESLKGELRELGITRADYMFDSDYQLTKAILKASRKLPTLKAARQVANALAVLLNELESEQCN